MEMGLRPFILSLGVLALTLASCRNREPGLVLISKDSNARIEKWLSSLDRKTRFREFYYIPSDSMDYFLDRADGIVIGGGEDVNPQMYGEPGYTAFCGEIDDFRDSIETILIRYAIDHDIPLMGICRGQQIINVVAGGSLIPDLPAFRPGPVKHQSLSDSAHIIFMAPGSWLRELPGPDTVWVNSRHHQAIDSLAAIFQVAAAAPDGIIESIEIKAAADHPFAVAVQWHPESLPDPLSLEIGRRFMENITK